MRSIQLVAHRVLEPRDMPQPPDPGPGQVLVRIRATGICGSDLHWFWEGGIGPHRAVYPQILGHEGAGDIVAVGPGVPASRVGERVAVEPAINCGHCELCLAGRHNCCPHSLFYGGPELPGMLREYALAPEHNAIPVPSGMSYEDVTVTEPVAVILHLMQIAPVRLGETVAILGSGPMGMVTAAMARLAGASRIFVGDRVAARLALARQMGADSTIHMPAESFADAVMDLTSGRGADIVFDAAGATETVNQGFRAARIGGRFVLIGLPSEQRLEIDMHPAMAKELAILTLRRSNNTTHQAVEWMRARRIPTAMITHRMPLEKTPEAFEMLAHYSDGVGKVIIEI